MIAYAARTSTKRNFAALAAAGWRIMISPATRLTHGHLPYALDNGAWSAFAGNVPWNEAAFVRALERKGPEADFVVVPDIVEGGAASLDLSKAWLARVLQHTRRALLAVQDGFCDGYIRPMLSQRVGVFVGGSTRFKEQTMAAWAQLAHACDAYCHVGRVNTVRRVALCQAAGVDSFDGSSVSRYVKNLPKLENARRQPDLLAPARTGGRS